MTQLSPENFADLRPARRRALGYDAATSSRRRRAPVGILKTEDDHLTVTGRKKLIGTARDLRRNYAIAKWMVTKHLDFVSTFTFQARTKDEGLNTEIENLMRHWGRRANCDVAGRHNLGRLTRLWEASRTLDGDVFVLRLSDGRLQSIEGDRVRTPAAKAKLPDGVKAKDMTHGVKTSPAGKALGYAVHKRVPKSSRFEFHRYLRAKHVEPLGYYDRIDQVRGISPMAPAINALQDTHEAFTYALARAKVAQMFGLAFYRDAPEGGLGDITHTEDGDGNEDKSSYTVDFAKGPVILDLEPGDRAEFIESNAPSQEFQGFTLAQIAMALKCLDLPYSFYDEKHTNYYGSRGALIQYIQSAGIKRKDLQELLDRLTQWRLGLWILDGDLVLPRGMTIADVVWEFVPTGLPWWNPLQEVKADALAIDKGLTSTSRATKQRGEDAYEIAREEAKFRIYAATLEAEVRTARQGLGLPEEAAPAKPTPAAPEDKQ